MYRSTLDNIKKIKIFGIDTSLINKEAMKSKIKEAILNKKKILIFSINVNAVNLAYKDKEFRQILNIADIVYCDGIGIKFAIFLFGYRLYERIALLNWYKDLFSFCQKENLSIFFLGDEEDILKMAVDKLKKEFPSLKILGFHHGFFDKDGDENNRIIGMINSFLPNILIVGFGMPLQEKWIYKNFKDIHANVFITAGATFRYIAGRLKPAPVWLSNIGLEWVFRLFQEPGRLWRRYILGNIFFAFLVIRELFYKMRSSKL